MVRRKLDVRATPLNFRADFLLRRLQGYAPENHLKQIHNYIGLYHYDDYWATPLKII